MAQEQPLDRAVPATVAEAERARIEVMQKASPAVIAILNADGGGGGSGVIISADGYALTNFHVSSGAGLSMKCGLPDGTLSDAVIVGIDPTGDVALIKLLSRAEYPAAVMGDSDSVQVGDWAFAMGNPFLLATDFTPTTTYGIISGIHRYQYPSGTILEYADCLQTDASINPGNSGGPLFNARGELIGINGRGSFEKRGRVNVGVAYAISINQIKNFLGHLKSGRVVDHATLGARLSTNLDGRVIVVDVLEDSDAYRRGLRYGDEVVSFAGRPIASVNAFKNVLGIFPQGWRVPLVYRRGDATERILVRLEGVHRTGELWEKVASTLADPEAKPAAEPGEHQHEEDKPAEETPPDEAAPADRPANEAPDDAKPEENQPQGEKPADAQPDENKPEGADPADKNPPGEKPSRARPLPGRPRLQRMGRPKPPMAAIARQHYEGRVGYANYWFNRQHQERLRKALVASGDFTPLRGLWTLKGDLAPHGDAEFKLDDKQTQAVLPGGPLRLLATDDFTSLLDPVDSGGLLVALHLWRQMLVSGFESFDEVHYLGTAPLDGHKGLFDVLVATHRGVECHFYFDSEDGRLAALEMYADDAADPCELYFGELVEVAGRLCPSRIEARYAGEVYGVFKFSHIELLGP
ncbi:MAG: trypsin-like peptidase domain-containing protein [Pirellulales bacterium]|nr:trypsin-like peptidase domain-containing protein [Pirellulales bacterium]